MKILESQNAALTNFEVYQHLINEQRKFHQDKDRKKQVPRSLQNTIKAVLDHFRTEPNPLSQRPLTYDADSIGRLVERLRDYNLTKGEMIMIFNVRPENAAVLSACLEDYETRFEEKADEILHIIEEVLGPFPPPKNEDGEASAS